MTSVTADDVEQPVVDRAIGEPKPPPVGLPMNVYDYLDKATLVGLNEQLESDVDITSFGFWLDECVAAGNVRQIVVDHIQQWNQLKAQPSEHVRGYEAYTVSRLGDWARLGLAVPSMSMFGAPSRAVSAKQPRNGPCACGSGQKFKRCHGAPAASAITA